MEKRAWQELPLCQSMCYTSWTKTCRCLPETSFATMPKMAYTAGVAILMEHISPGVRPVVGVRAVCLDVRGEGVRAGSSRPDAVAGCSLDEEEGSWVCEACESGGVHVLKNQRPEQPAPGVSFILESIEGDVLAAQTSSPARPL